MFIDLGFLVRVVDSFNGKYNSIPAGSDWFNSPIELRHVASPGCARLYSQVASVRVARSFVGGVSGGDRVARLLTSPGIYAWGLRRRRNFLSGPFRGLFGPI